MERELARSTAQLKLEEAKNKARPPLAPPDTPEEWQARAENAIDDFLRFLRPLSQYPPFNRLFCNHIWMTAGRLP